MTVRELVLDKAQGYEYNAVAARDRGDEVTAQCFAACACVLLDVLEALEHIGIDVDREAA